MFRFVKIKRKKKEKHEGKKFLGNLFIAVGFQQQKKKKQSRQTDIY